MRRGGGGFDAPPNYVALPAAARQQAEDLSGRSHDVARADRLSGVLALHIEGIDPLHVGTGDWETWEIDETKRELVLRTATQSMTVDGETLAVPVIPGASLKGAIRTLCEAIAGGCALEQPCRGPCVICGLFGKADREGAFAGRVGFGDAHPEDPGAAFEAVGLARLPEGRQPRKRTGRRLYVPQKASEARMPYQVVAPGIPFHAELLLANVTEAELGLVLLALGVDGTFNPRIGGGKYAGLGRVRVTAVGGRIRRGYRQPRAERLDEERAKALGAAALEAYRPPEDGKPALDLLRTHLRPPGGAR